MAFKTIEQYNDERYRNMFRLVNDKESADVVFLYRSRSDMLEADVHYVRSDDYSGYVHCCGPDCPACAKGLRIQPKIFIPLYNIRKNKVEFWDRTPKFEPQFKHDVFDKFPDPSEYVFTIVRHGLPNDRDTRYEITAAGRNTVPGMSYDELIAKFNIKFPDYYENVIKTVPEDRLSALISDTNNNVTQDYVPVPRAGYQSSVPDTFINAETVVHGPSASVDSSYVADAADSDDGELPDPIF